MNSFERFKNDIQNGIIKAIELIDIDNSVIKHNAHALIFNCPMSVISSDNSYYYLKYYSKDLDCFQINDAPFPSEKYYKNNGYKFTYDGDYIDYQKDTHVRYKVHKNRTYFIKEEI